MLEHGPYCNTHKYIKYAIIIKMVLPIMLIMTMINHISKNTPAEAGFQTTIIMMIDKECISTHLQIIC